MFNRLLQDFCCYCGNEFTKVDREGNKVFSHGGIFFHQTCRAEALQNAIRSCQEEIKASIKK